MIGHQAAMLWREAERQCDVERLQPLHLEIEPTIGVRAKTIGPTKPRAEPSHSEIFQQGYRGLEPRIFKMKPLTDPQVGRVTAEIGERLFRGAIFAHKTHVEMPVVR